MVKLMAIKVLEIDFFIPITISKVDNNKTIKN